MTDMHFITGNDQADKQVRIISNINVKVAKIYHELKIFKTGAAELKGC
jgi:hypothetical protein